MVRDFHVAATDDGAGTYVGLLTAAFCTAQFMSSALWGAISDRIGRRRSIVLGVLGSMVASILFGTATHYSQALIARLVAGFLNGNIGVVKSLLGDLSDDTNRTRAFSVLPLMWGVGSATGPVLGGMLLRPAATWPHTQWGVFETYPYLLPIAVGVALQCLALAGVVVALTDHGEPSLLDRWGCTGGARRGRGGYSRVQSGVELTAVAADDDAAESVEDDAGAADAGSDASSVVKGGVPARRSACALLRDRAVVTSVLTYGTLALTYIVFDEAAPLLMSARVEKGGLGFDGSQLGQTVAVGGVSLLIYVRALLRAGGLCVADTPRARRSAASCPL